MIEAVERHDCASEHPCNTHWKRYSNSMSPKRRRNSSMDPPALPREQSSRPRTPKRQRTRSLGCTLPLPLTEENLHLLEQSTMKSHLSYHMSAPRNPSPTRKDSTLADQKQLEGYNITIDLGSPRPADLQRLIENLRQTRSQQPSPHSQQIVDLRRAALAENEVTARQMMEVHILFHGELSPDGIKGLTIKNQINLTKEFLPPPPRSPVLELWGSLARPQPDSCIGYITQSAANKHIPALTMPFTREEDAMADWFNVVQNGEMHFPFLTAQWKTAISGENQIQASIQAARDGAVIVNYMHHIYSTAYPKRTPTPLETCHFSLTVELYTIMLWIHWREIKNGEVYYRMEMVDTAFMHKINDLLEMRKMLHNYIEYAMGERLQSIKKALPLAWANRSKKLAKGKSQASSVSGSLKSGPILKPSSDGSEDTFPEPTKRRRT